MDGSKKTLRYARHLLRDQRGFLEWFIPMAVGFMFSTAKGAIQQRAVSKSGKHYEERMLGLARQQELAGIEMDTERIKEIRLLNESRLEVFKASSFQQGSYTGPYFQVVKR